MTDLFAHREVTITYPSGKVAHIPWSLLKVQRKGRRGDDQRTRLRRELRRTPVRKGEPHVERKLRTRRIDRRSRSSRRAHHRIRNAHPRGFGARAARDREGHAPTEEAQGIEAARTSPRRESTEGEVIRRSYTPRSGTKRYREHRIRASARGLVLALAAALCFLTLAVLVNR